MELDTFRFMIQPFVDFFAPILLGGFSASGVVELLKSRMFPELFNRFPRTTNLGASIVAALVAVYFSPANLVLNHWWQIAAFFVGILVTSAFFYHQLWEGLTKDGKYSARK